MQPGEYYNKEANIMTDIARFRKAAYTKDLMNSVGTQVLMIFLSLSLSLSFSLSLSLSLSLFLSLSLSLKGMYPSHGIDVKTARECLGTHVS